MSDEAVQDGAPEEGKPKRFGAALMLAGALVVGGGAGVAVVGPMAADRLAASPADAAGSAEDYAGGGESDGHGQKDGGKKDKKGHGKKGGHGGSPHYTVESLVLNPAETQGTRFLMATIVVSVGEEEQAEALMDRDPEVRDRLMSLLGSKTVDELSDVSFRDGIKAEIGAAVTELVGAGVVQAVFLPTFVIQ